MSGIFDKENIPTPVKALLKEYERQILLVNKTRLVKKQIYTPPTVVIQPMISTEWGQQEPYNADCPVVEGQHSLTGCVATAMAQIMNYYQWPKLSTTSIESYVTAKGVSVDALPSTTFDWANMKDRYDIYSTIASRKAVSKLMAYCGAAVKMDYSPTGSGAYTDDVVPALVDKFGYARTVRVECPDDYTLAEWDSVMINELTNKRPVLLAGISSIAGGHAFVCDAYDGKGMYRINWGWYGGDNGYYRLSLLDPHIAGISFGLWGEAVIGIQPTSDENVNDHHKPFFSSRIEIMGPSTYHRDNVSAAFNITGEDGVTFLQGLSLVNITGGVDVGMAVIDGHNIVKVLTSKRFSVQRRSIISLDFGTFKIGENEINGHYKLAVVYKTDNDGTWVLPRSSGQYCVDVNFNDSVLTLESLPKPDFKINTVKMEENVDGEGSKRLTLYFTNNGYSYKGNLYLATQSFAGVTAVSVPEGASDSAQFYIPKDIELDIYAVAADRSGNNILYTNATAEGTDMNMKIDIVNADENGCVIGNDIRTRTVIKNNGGKQYRYDYSLFLKRKGGVDEKTEINEPLIVNSNDSVVIEKILNCFDSDSVSVEGRVYTLHDSTELRVESRSIVAGKGVIYHTADGAKRQIHYNSTSLVVPEDAVVANIRYSNVRTATANHNPNTIYLMTKAVKGLTSNLVGASNTSANIRLNDNNPYYIPNNIYSVNTTLSTKVYAGGWRMISLPFAPDHIVDNTTGNSLSWKKNPTGNGDFVLLEFDRIEGDDVLFVYTDKIRADRIYLISYPETLDGHQLTFSKANDTLYTSPKMISSQWIYGRDNQKVDNIYIVKDNDLVLSDAVDVSPFNAYFIGIKGKDHLKLITPEEAYISTGITVIDNNLPKNTKFYDLKGNKLTNPLRGFYINRGKKFIKH